MGHKVHPTGFRLGVVKGWQSRWYAERDYKDLVSEDRLLRETIQKELANASVSRIEIERAATNQVSVTIHTAKPGIVIGKSGEKVDKLRAELERKTKKRVRLNIVEIRQPELDAYLVGRSIAEQLEKRISFRRAMKQAVQKTMRANAKGIRVIVGGRLGGAEIARSEKEVEGKIPLHTLRADIDYGLAEAHTTFGVIGIKVWIYKGDILPDKRREGGEAQQEVATPFAPRERGDGGNRRGDRRGGRGERGTRGQGERSQVGERQPRGERPARGQGERPPRAPGERGQGERPPRAPGERVQRGERGQGERAQGGERGQGERAQGGERPARTPRSQGERPARAGRTGRPAEQTAAAPETQAASENQVPAVQGVQETEVTQAPETQAVSESQTPAVQDVQETEVTQAPPAPGDGDGATESE